jgi:predicted acylesterase/phospholipase RssA
MDTPRLRAGLPFRRIALVLSGGGALGAYEVGVLKVLEALRIAPAMVSGVSVGAYNAVMWVAHGGRTAPLEQLWCRMRGANLGLHWLALALRAGGAFGAALAILELALTFLGSREMSGAYWIWKKGSSRADLWSTQLDLVGWILTAVVCVLVVLFARRIEGWMARGAATADPARQRLILGRVLLGLALAHAVVWLMGWAWPHRFSASLLLGLLFVWLAGGTGVTGRWTRRMTFGLMPETGGRGLWSGAARRRVLERIVREGDPRRLVDGGTALTIGALAVDSGRVAHFINWPHPSPAFARRVEVDLGEIIPLRTPDEVVRAAVASSAIPGVFEPERIDGRDFVDAGGFSNQPLHVAIANDSDAVLVVLLTPSNSPTPSPPPADLFELAGRLLELANWRDMQTELRELPSDWRRDGDPARLVVVEPLRALPGTVLGFDPDQAAQLIAFGEQDAWRALERAGWLGPAGA